MIGLVLKEVRRKGKTVRFDVIRPVPKAGGRFVEILKDIPAGEYHVMTDGEVTKVKTSYRTVQDVEVVA